MRLAGLIMLGLDSHQMRCWREPALELGTMARGLGVGVDGLVMLRTCERHEAYMAISGARPLEQLRAAGVQAAGLAVGARCGVDVVRHALRVASGLESRLIGEPHVLGQVKRAALAARQAGVLGRDLQALFAAALRCGRRIRRETALGRAAATYTDLAVERVATQLCGSTAPRVAIIGTGAVAVEIGARLRERGFQQLTIVGRHEGRTNALAACLNAQSATLSELVSLLHRVDAVIAATSAKHAIVRSADLAEVRRRLCIIDLGMPPNVEAKARAAPGASYFGLDDLAPATRPVSTMIAQAQEIVEQEIQRLLGGTRHDALMEHAA